METTLREFSHFQIRKARPEEAQTIAQINVISSKDIYQGILSQSFLDQLDTSKRTQVYVKRLADPSVDCIVALETRNQQIIAFTDFGPSRNQELGYESELYSIYCLPGFQKRGAGKLLIQECLERCKNRYRNMFVSVFTANLQACGFYERLGAKAISPSTMKVGDIDYPISNFAWHFQSRTSS